MALITLQLRVISRLDFLNSAGMKNLNKENRNFITTRFIQPKRSIRISAACLKGWKIDNCSKYLCDDEGLLRILKIFY